ncbi:MAG: calcium/proton exchanger [Chloroflexia bacterium]
MRSNRRQVGMRSWIDLLLVFVPLALVLEYAAGAPPLAVFIAAGFAIVPLAGWLGHATEMLAARLGTGLGSFLNATFGNATELIIAFFALRAGQAEVVKASLIGSIIGNLLLVLGAAALFGGWRHAMLRFDAEQVKVRASLLVIAIIGFVVPAVVDFNAQQVLSEGKSLQTDERLSLGVALVLLLLYLSSLVFTFRTHTDLLSDEEMTEGEAAWSPMRAIVVLLAATVAIAFMSELLVGALEGFTEAVGLPATFVGLIIIPIIGNAAEHASAVTFALKAKMELAVGIALGSALQIALLVAPLLVLLSWVIGQPMDLVLRGPLELTALIGAVFIGNAVARDGETHWYEGLMLLGVYAIFALAFFFSPGGA